MILIDALVPRRGVVYVASIYAAPGDSGCPLDDSWTSCPAFPAVHFCPSIVPSERPSHLVSVLSAPTGLKGGKPLHAVVLVTLTREAGANRRSGLPTKACVPDRPLLGDIAKDCSPGFGAPYSLQP